MATPTNTVNILNTSIMESLAKTISNVQPIDTPFVSSLSREGARSHIEEWQVDAYNSVVTTARPYGDDYTAEERVNPTRRQNVIQTIHRSFIVADEEEKAMSAGFNSRMTFEIMKCGVEQKIDIENILIKLNQASDIPTSSNSVTGKTASLMSFLETNVSAGASGANGGWNSSTKEYAARTDGTQRAFTETMLIDILGKLWQNSGSINGVTIYTNIAQKQKFNAFDGIADLRKQTMGMGQATIVGAANVYVGDHGVTRVMLNRHMRDRDVFLTRNRQIKLKTYWMFRPRRLQVTGNNRRWGMSSSFTLCVKNEKEHGMIADLTTS